MSELGGLNWIKEVDNPEDHLTGEALETYRTLGLEGFIKLYEECLGTQRNYSKRDLRGLMKKFISQNFTGDNTKKIARHLGTTEKTVRTMLTEKES